MSAECSTHGCDLVYPSGSWPLGVCRECELEAEIERKDDALRDILDFVDVGWSEPMSEEARLELIRKYATEAIRGKPTLEAGGA